MNLFAEAIAWLADPTHWSGPGGIPTRVGQHLLITFAAVAIAAIVSIPSGVLIGHLRRGAGFIGAITGAARAIPTLGLLTLFGLALGIGLTAPLLALVILAIPSLLAGAYAGVQAVDPDLPGAARAIGMSPLQVVGRVEFPLALPVVVGGLRAATLQVVATATLAAYTSNLGLGRYLFAGLKSRDYAQMLAGALIVAVLALVLELALAACQRLAARRFARPGSHPRTGRRGARSTDTTAIATAASRKEVTP
ncbi:ABC transporter permease subunit [Leucobacter sp. CSA1]|uniref:ABC transporter permease subunit n=1 Tax=Leucobacter chromiisoli TaxID=2796471 RepID=A0A934Q702_9MICO|nr:ABC transporter permease subunit [Leucobacter chromiisoli]MBK0418231.1 ABC transporter permease subunit [Leucobacter chromiisoli]